MSRISGTSVANAYSTTQKLTLPSPGDNVKTGQQTGTAHKNSAPSPTKTNTDTGAVQVVLSEAEKTKSNGTVSVTITYTNETTKTDTEPGQSSVARSSVNILA